jgi:hypothetical protein
MKNLFNLLRKTFAAGAFAEMSEDQTALQMAGLQRIPDKSWQTLWEKSMAAVSFAESNCHGQAREFLGGEDQAKDTRSLDAFLDSVGLRGVSVSYGLARI